MSQLQVLITVDTEFWPDPADLSEAGLARSIGRDIYGETASGDFGIGRQMDVLDAHGLKGVFLVEALCSQVVGLEPLRKMVELIQSRGHDVQLHIHPEWLAWMPEPLLAERRGQNLKEFSLSEQILLLQSGLEALRQAGAKDVCAFRAGNYGADFATLRALEHLGIRFDTSYNFCYLDAECGLRLPRPMTQPGPLEGVCEVPITFFSDYPGHHRHVQLRACSFREMRGALLEAHRLAWPTFVIVSHSFELLKSAKPGRAPRPDPIVMGRFERLCRFLAENPGKFRTSGFADLDQGSIERSDVPSGQELKGSIVATLLRYVEQSARRV